MIDINNKWKKSEYEKKEHTRQRKKNKCRVRIRREWKPIQSIDGVGHEHIRL